MNLNSVHLVLSYKCTRTCPHCFHFGTPDNDQVMTFSQVQRYVEFAAEIPSVQWVFFEGGEPMLFFPLLMEGIRAAKEVGLHTAVVTNGYWITSLRDTIPYLKQFRDVGLNALQVSCDELHGNMERIEPMQADLVEVAKKASILVQFIGVSEKPTDEEPLEARRGEPIVNGNVVYRGRAARRLTERQASWLWSSFDECPHENLRDPYRIHVDPYGYVMLCQGLSIGNLEKKSLLKVMSKYSPDEHKIVGPLLKGGPAELVVKHRLDHHEGYVDACHLCYNSRRLLRREQKLDSLKPVFLYSGRVKGKNKKNR